MTVVNTGYEPSGNGWEFVDEQVINTAPAGTPTVAEYTDATLLTLAGIELFGSVGINDIVGGVTQKGFRTYYVSRWKQPPSFLGTGITTYRIVIVRSN